MRNFSFFFNFFHIFPTLYQAILPPPSGRVKWKLILSVFRTQMPSSATSTESYDPSLGLSHHSVLSDSLGNIHLSDTQ